MNEFDFKNPDYSKIFALRARRLTRLREQPERIPELLAYYKNNPAQMINDWGCTADPRNIERNLPAVVPFILFPRQEEWISEVMQSWKAQKPLLSVKSRDMGLSWLSVALASVLCITHDEMNIGFGSRKEVYVDLKGSPKSLFHKARQFISLLPPELRGGFVRGATDPAMRLGFPNTGSIISGESGDGIGRGDRAAIYFVDESAFLERPQLTEASLSQTTNCRVDVSTPNGLANPFAEKIMSGKFNVFRFHWRDDPRKDEAWYKKQKEELDPVTLAQEVDIDFSASVDGVLIPSSWVQAAIDSHKVLGIDPYGEKMTALDVADLGKDANAHSFRNGILLEDVREWHGKTTEDIYGTTQQAHENCDEWECYELRYDSDGVGSGVRGDSRVLNESRKKPQRINAIAFHGGSEVLDKEKEIVKGRTNGDFFENFKAQSWWGLRNKFKLTYEAVELGKDFDPSEIISISSKCEALLKIQSELSQPTYKKSARGKIMINKAPDGTKSPNIADSINMLYAPMKSSVDYSKLL